MGDRLRVEALTSAQVSTGARTLLPKLRARHGTARRGILKHMNEEVGPPLSEAEGRMLMNLLARHCAHGVDQWDSWRLRLPSGDFYVLIEDGMAPAGLPAERFYQVWPPRDPDTSE